MLKVLIACKNLSTVKTIINKILSEQKNLQLIGISNSLAETKEIIFKSEPDIVFTTDSHIITFLENNVNFYTPKIVLFSKNEPFYTDDRIMLILNYSMSFKEMCKHISSFIQQNVTDSKRELATNMLNELGFNFKLTGTVYLLDSILYASTYKGSYSFEQLKRDVYSYVAKQNNTNEDRVKWSITRSVNVMYDHLNRESYHVVEKYFGLKYPKRPTPKLVISVIANSLDN